MRKYFNILRRSELYIYFEPDIHWCTGEEYYFLSFVYCWRSFLCLGTQLNILIYDYRIQLPINLVSDGCNYTTTNARYKCSVSTFRYTLDTLAPLRRSHALTRLSFLQGQQ